MLCDLNDRIYVVMMTITNIYRERNVGKSAYTDQEGEGQD